MAKSDLHSRLRLGWVGAGRMGLAMASRLASGGNDVAVWNRTRAKAEPLTSNGAAIVDSISDLVDRDIVFTVVGNSADFEEITTGPHGLLSSPDASPRIIVDHSTVSVEASERVAAAADKRGCALLCAPVSGNAHVVAAGTASLIVSGPRAAYDEVAPYLLQVVQAATYLGEGTVARVVKLAHNAFLGGLIATLVEVTALAEKAGVPRALFLQFINASPLGSRFTKYKTPALVNLEFTPTFTTALLKKDLELALAEGRRLAVPMSTVALVSQTLQSAIGHGYAEVDFAALLEVQARGSAIELRSESVDYAEGVLAGR
jgi:3-hydroxyisobutyrate dehydrogenase